MVAQTPVVEEYRITVHEPDSPLGPEHTFPCPCCRQHNAVFDTNRGVFGPCYACQSNGLFLLDTRQIHWWQLPTLWRWFKRERRIAERNRRFFYEQNGGCDE